MIRGTQSVERRFGEIGRSAGDSPEQDDTLLVGDRNDRIDQFRRWVLTKIAHQKCANFAPSHSPESAGGGLPNLRVQVVEKIAQQSSRSRPTMGAPAGVGADLRVAVPQQLQHRTGRESGAEPRGSGDGLLQTRPLNHAFGDQPNQRLRRITAADRTQRIERSRLLGHQPVGAKPAKTPACRFEGRDRRQ